MARLTTAQALVRYLIAQRTVVDGVEVPLFPGVFGIFGHGNVVSLGHALQEAGDALPTWRGQNEQGMALAAIGYAKAARRRQIMVATTSIGPGALNMVTAAGVAHANRLPVLLLCGDTFASRVPDPVLQQVEHFGDPTLTVNDAFKPVVRYWDRINRPEQLIPSLPQAVATMLDPANCGPAFLSLPQDVQAEAYDFPEEWFEVTVHHPVRPRPDTGQLAAAAELLRGAERPLIVAGGGVHYSQAEAELTAFAERHGIPVVETVAGKASLLASHPLYGGPLGVTGSESANHLAGRADVVLAVGTRLGDFTTGSWTVFSDPSTRIIGLNAAAFDAGKHRSQPLVGDAAATLPELSALLGGAYTSDEWRAEQARQVSGYHEYIDRIASPDAVGPNGLPTYAQVVGVADRSARQGDYALTAAGGFPGELNNGWRARHLDSFDCEYGFSCMGYEISGAWGAKMARPDGEVIVFVGDGSYLMMNSDLYSSVLSGHKLIVIVCDNGGFAVINRLQVNQGGVPFNNQIADTRHRNLVYVDFAAHAASMGCIAESVATVAELESALERARSNDRTTVIALRTEPNVWTEGGCFWEVGVPEVSNRPEVLAAHASMQAGKQQQRIGR
ncbi:MAG: 3D-(3,5/4)-trihydroxycyclohexane-1,2-dione acylhydrolase (decyclizing) [Acidobacteria bacterium]|nr:3D-(3,5/4)-trihydroxycyclohexane-1,2-dione acylhydrolase (decyclizing) [Acidobacteriota bacterium]